MAKEFILQKTEASWLATIASLYDLHEEAEGNLKIVVTNSGRRSVSQNSLAWMWYGEIAAQTRVKGYGVFDSEDIHEYMKDAYCPNKPLVMGKKTLSIKSTKKLDTGEMTHYLNQIHQWAINAGFSLTMPHDSEYMRMMEIQNK